MLQIMFGVLPSTKILLDIEGKNHTNGDILKTKFIAHTHDGIVFAALVDDTCQQPALTFALNNVRCKRPSKRECDLNALQAHIKNDGSHYVSKKTYRKLNNLTMTQKNWKQFIGNKNVIINQISH